MIKITIDKYVNQYITNNSDKISEFSKTELLEMIEFYEEKEDDPQLQDCIEGAIHNIIEMLDELPKLQQKINKCKGNGLFEAFYGPEPYTPLGFINFEFEEGDTSSFLPKQEALIIYNVFKVIGNLSGKGIIDISDVKYSNTCYNHIVESMISEIQKRIGEDSQMAQWCIRETLSIFDMGWEEYAILNLKRRGIVF